MGNGLPEVLRACITVSEVDDGAFFAGELFKRKFGDALPDVPHHVVAFYRDPSGALWPASYVHFRPFGDIHLVGGGCTDGQVIRRMREDERAAVNAAGGLLRQTLLYGFDRYASACEAFFGYCGDARAYEVDIAAGFRDTEHAKLLVNFHKPIHDVLKRALIAKAQAIGPF